MRFLVVKDVFDLLQELLWLVHQGLCLCERSVQDYCYQHRSSILLEEGGSAFLELFEDSNCFVFAQCPFPIFHRSSRKGSVLRRSVSAVRSSQIFHEEVVWRTGMGQSLKFPDIMTQRIFSDIPRAGYFLADVGFCFISQLLQGVSWIGVHILLIPYRVV